MIHGIGVDVVSLERVARMHERWGERLERRLLDRSERGALPKESRSRLRRIALAVAAKEAFAKAMGTGLRWPASLHQIAVARDDLGAPRYAPREALSRELRERGISAVHLSLSDDAGAAVALAVMERGK